MSEVPDRREIIGAVECRCGFQNEYASLTVAKTIYSDHKEECSFPTQFYNYEEEHEI